jgi:peptide/nickel transport system substrate-binding protein
MKNKKYILSLLKTFSLRQWVFFYLSILVITFSILFLAYTSIKNNLQEIPLAGGTHVEGIVGSVRFINPVLAVSDTDKEITDIVYRGLYRKNNDGEVVPVLATDLPQISEDGLTYTITLKDKLVFHDNSPVTSEDILYTIKQIQDPNINSPRRIAWQGVNVKVLSPNQIEFKLKQRFTDFLDMLTVGILSKKEWVDVTPEAFALSDKNLAPIGTGPYTVTSVKTQTEGIPEKISFKRFKKYAEDAPYIKKLNLVFFENEKDALFSLELGNIDSVGGISPENTKLVKNNIIEKTSLPRLFGLFFNKNKVNIFQDKEVIEAIEYAINKQTIIDQVFGGYATTQDTIIPFTEESTKKTQDIDKATALLEKNGWEKDENGFWEKNKKILSFKISTTDVSELNAVNTLIQQQLNSFGMKVEIETVDSSSFNQQILNPRAYEVLLFGQIVSKPSNLYAFWHSNERNAPGLNVTMYANTKVDTLLEKIKKESDKKIQDKNLVSLEKEIEVDKPMIPLFQPIYISAYSRKIFNRNYDIKNGALRFTDIHLWSIKTDHVWSVFTSNQ